MKYLCFILFLPLLSPAQSTVGFQFVNPGITEGYTLLVPSTYTATYLIDNCGREINRWSSTYRPGQAAYLKSNGNLVRSGNIGGIYFIGGGKGGILEEFDWQGNKIWHYEHYSSQYCLHHDFTILPNGNILAIAWEKIERSVLENMGRDPATIGTNFWSEKIIEIQPIYPTGGTIVWEWHAIDHVIQDYNSNLPGYSIVSDYPELLDLNYTGSNPNFTDWLHFNSIRYNDSLDQILFSSRYFSEFYIIDHSTSTTEAAGHSGGIYGRGGDLLYRWGNPAAYQRGSGSDQKLFQQHSVQWVPYGYPNEGAIAVFNNGTGRPGTDYSSAEILLPPGTGNGIYPLNNPFSYGPDSIVWKYMDTTHYYLSANIVSGVQAMPNGNVVVCDGPAGKIYEVNTAGIPVWLYISPVNITGPVSQGSSIAGNVIFRADKYLPDFPGFAGRDMTPGNPIELNPVPNECDVTILNKNDYSSDYNPYPNPSGDMINFPCIAPGETHSVSIYSVSGHKIFHITFCEIEKGQVHVSGYPCGLYLYKAVSGTKVFNGTFVVSH